MEKRTPRVVLQESPRITVCFPNTYTNEQVDIWLAKWLKDRQQLH
jgi:hypothetical protein